MKIELGFNGTISDFLTLIDLFSIERMQDPGNRYRWNLSDNSSESFLLLDLWDIVDKCDTSFFIKAIKLPGNRSRLLVYCPEDKWSKLKENWDLLLAEMNRQGWINPEASKPKKPQKPSKGAEREGWFVYYYACQKAGIKYTHEDMANDLHLSPGHTRTIYSNWKKSQNT
jgi:hypothetical protein